MRSGRGGFSRGKIDYEFFEESIVEISCNADATPREGGENGSIEPSRADITSVQGICRMC